MQSLLQKNSTITEIFTGIKVSFPHLFFANKLEILLRSQIVVQKQSEKIPFIFLLCST